MAQTTHKRGRPVTVGGVPWEKPTEPILLKKLLADIGISNREFGSLLGVSSGCINLVLNKQYLPRTDPGFKNRAEELLKERDDVKRFLAGRERDLKDIWTPVNENLFALRPSNMSKRQSAGQRKRQDPAIVPGNPVDIFQSEEVEMIAPDAMKRFKLFRNPFVDDIEKDSDIFMGEDHRYIYSAMMMTAKHGGFLAVVGEVGSGKSVIRRKVVRDLQKDGSVLVIYPQIIDKSRVTAGSICDAIIMDISKETPKMRLEAKTRQVHQLLKDRAKSGYQSCLVFEEAHDLTIPTLKYLKRFLELEDGFKKLLGIILIGQPELRDLFDEAQNVDMREVIRRVQVAEIRGLNGSLEQYLELKFKRVGTKIDSIFTKDAFDALNRRLTGIDEHRGTVNHAYPLLVNSSVAKAINLAWEMGEEKVTAEIIDAI